ncbi:MAG: hypothetical protein HN576_16265 [Bacteriovoracaceae bacterium]|jgi:hypothetical protein|nr:hypothetical protein [Bacteriovoracaceae bacterium]
MATKQLVMGMILSLSFVSIALANDKDTMKSINKELSVVNKELQLIQEMTSNRTRDIHSKEGVKLSSSTKRKLRLNLRKVDGAVFNVSKQSLVKSGNKQGIYRVRDGYFKFLPVYILLDDKESLKILVNGVHHGDQVVLNSEKLQLKKTTTK